jgi:hypothetical protein
MAVCSLLRLCTRWPERSISALSFDLPLMFDRRANIVSIDCSKEQRFEGSDVSGFIKLDTKLAKEKGVTTVKASLQAVIEM